MLGVALFRFADRRTPCRRVAPEGTAQLIVAMPARQSQEGRRKAGAAWRRCSSGSIPTRSRRPSRSSTRTRGSWRPVGSAPTRPAMRKHVSAWPDRVWAVEGSNGAGRPLAQRLLADGEHVVDVPAKLSARARLFDTGHNRKTDAHDAHAVAAVAVRTTGLRVLAYDVELEALRMLATAARNSPDNASR